MILSAISLTLNGMPATLLSPTAVDQVLGPDQLPQLPGVELGDQHLVAGEHLTEVGGEGVEVAEVGGGHLLAFEPAPAGRPP
jgi:hypothetical protein